MSIKTFPLPGPINLLVRAGHGSVTVQTRDDLREATVRLTASSPDATALDDIVVEMQGPTLQVIAPRQGGIFDLPLPFLAGHRALGALDMHITVPSGTAVKITSVTAAITVEGRIGGGDVAFGAADVRIGSVDGDLRARFGSGTLVVDAVGGSVQVRSASGRARFGEVGGEVQSSTGSGDLQVGVVHGTVVSRCGSGGARLSEVHGDVVFASGSGGLELGLPAGVTARLDLHTGAGQVRSELPIEAEPRTRKGSITVRARTGNGDVRVFRAA
jgi:hypothetical protein